MGWQNKHKIQNKAKCLAVRILQYFGNHYSRGLFLVLCFLVVETESQLLHFAETVLHINVYCLTVGGERGVIQAEHIFCERIAVVRLEDSTIIIS